MASKPMASHGTGKSSNSTKNSALAVFETFRTAHADHIQLLPFDGLCCVLELSRHGCASCAPSRRVTFLRRRGEAHPSTSSSSARAAAPPSMAAAAAEAAAAATVRCPFLFEYTPNAPLSATHPPSAGAGRCSRRRADVVRAAAPRAAGCRPCWGLRCALAQRRSPSPCALAAAARARSRRLSRRPGPPCHACSCPVRWLSRRRRRGPAAAASAATRRDRACVRVARIVARDDAARLDSLSRAGARDRDLGQQPRRGTGRHARRAPRPGARAWARPRAPGVLSPPTTSRAPLLLLTLSRGSCAVRRPCARRA